MTDQEARSAAMGYSVADRKRDTMSPAKGAATVGRADAHSTTAAPLPAGSSTPDTTAASTYRGHVMRRRGAMVSIYKADGTFLMSGRLGEPTVRLLIDQLADDESAA